MSAQLYKQLALSVIKEARSIEDLRQWWKDEQPNREKHGLTPDDMREILDACENRKAVLHPLSAG